MATTRDQKTVWDEPQSIITTTLFISNLHCPSCVHTIEDVLLSLSPKPVSISASIVSHSVVVRHDTALTVETISDVLGAAGFDIHSVFQDHTKDIHPVESQLKRRFSAEWEDSLEEAVTRWRQSWRQGENNEQSELVKRKRHFEQCPECRREAEKLGSADTLPLLQVKPSPVVAADLKSDRSISTPSWNRTASSDGTADTVNDEKFVVVDRLSEPEMFKAELSIVGMTCSSCVAGISGAVNGFPWVRSIDVSLLTNSATVVFEGRHHVDELANTIADTGFDVTVEQLEELKPKDTGGNQEATVQRTVAIRVDGMYCHHCPGRIMQKLEETYGTRMQFEKPLTVSEPILKIKYVPQAPDFTIRHIITAIKAVDPAFNPSIYHPPTIEEKVRELHARERRRILLRLALALACTIPGFVIGVVCMQLLAPTNPARRFVMEPLWAGNVSRGQWALFILATPVYFFSADAFHRKAIKEVRALWRPGSTTPILKRFYRFGSMNMLMSLGTSIAYFSSIAELALAATEKSHHDMSSESMYFDSVIFLTMFLLIGRFLEAYSKTKAGNAVTALAKLRPTEAILMDSTVESNATGRSVNVDLLEVGDTVRVPHGSSPPFDGSLVDAVGSFDESSLTGESHVVAKKGGDTAFSGTVNKGGPVLIQLTSASGTSMLDQIIKVVREGQTRRAPVERAADLITGHFVPIVVLIGIATWVVWLTLGLSGALPSDYRDNNQGGWPLWALRFSIAVFVIACPCGIGLAAPTALFVGGGMAAKHGILVKDGGAFQEASTLDRIVFDKTGTLTQGGDPAVTDHKVFVDSHQRDLFGMVRTLEESSNHPVAKALVSFCAAHSGQNLQATNVEEIPGKGVEGNFKMEVDSEKSQGPSLDVDIIVGNEALMADHTVSMNAGQELVLSSWKSQGKSVALVAQRMSDPSTSSRDPSPWTLSAIFAISDPVRPEAASIIRALRNRGVAVWMLSGDNQTTAQAVGATIGIPKINIIAGVLPDQKAEKIQYLQKILPRRRRRPHATVAMVGDGINDAPALATADIGIAIGSGTDVAIASAAFILMSSDLRALLTLVDLSRVVFRRVWFNFGWALVYNVVLIPVAAGALYPIKSGGQHVVLDPVWASLAMALSSVSVVCSSLLLRSRIPFVGFRVKDRERIV